MKKIFALKVSTKLSNIHQNRSKIFLTFATFLLFNSFAFAQVPATPILQGPANPCSNSNSGNLTYTITNAQAGVTYYWTFKEYTSVSCTVLHPVLVTGTGTSTTGVYNYHWTTNNGGTVQVYGVNASGTGPTSTLVVNPCCYGTAAANQYINPPFTINYATNTINSISFTNNPNPIYINGTIDFIGNFTISNCPIINMGTGSQLTVSGNNTLTLVSSGSAANRTILRAGCDASWLGILLKDEKSKIVVDKATIEDAEIAIKCNNGATFSLLNNAVLNKNGKGIVVDSYVATTGLTNIYSGSIKNSFILAGTVTYNTTNANVVSFTSTGTQLNCWRSYVGMELIGSLTKPTFFTVGTTADLSNTFDNLTIGIMCRDASLTAKKNKFSNIKFSQECATCSGCTGKAICSTNSNTNVATDLIAGDALASNANTFNICDNGVFASTNQNVTIQNNMFTYIYGGTVSAPTGSAIEVTSCKGTAFYSNVISATYNTINHSGLGIWVHNNDGANTIDLSNNLINFTSGYTTIPNGSGIIAQQNSNAASTLLYVNTNKVFRLKNGIQIDQFNLPVCGGNLVDYITQVASTTWAYGISVTNSPGAMIKSNTARSTGTNYWHTGIKSDFCPNSEVSCNKVENIGFGFQIGGTQTSMKFLSNQMITNTVGLGLGYTAIGDQTLIGATPAPSDNTWTGTFTNHTKSDYSNYLTAYSNLNLQGSTGTIYYPLGMSNISNPFLPPYHAISISSNIAGSQPPCSPPPAMMVQGSGGNLTPVEATLQEEALDIIGSSSSGALYEETTKWNNKYFLYSYLKNDSILVNSDSTITAFNDSAKIANMGSIENGETLLGNLKDATTIDITDKMLELSSMVPENLVEQNMMDIQMQELEKQISNSGYSLQEINDLRSLATQCPYEAGVAVFKARVILAGIEGPNKVYVNACERLSVDISSNRIANKNDIKTDSKFQVFLSPNPTSSNFNIDIESEGDFHGKIEIFDLFGKVVFSSPLLGSHTEIFTNEISSGFYFYKIFNSVDLINDGKLIIAK